MAKASVKVRSTKDVDYTITGLVVIVAVVIISGLFFARPNVAVSGGNIGGQAIGTGSSDPLAPQNCEAASYCDGSRLLRQSDDCRQYEAFCTYGCSYDNGQARCNS